MFVVTLIADPEKEPLTQALADSISHMLSMQGVRVEKREWLKDGAALDLFARHPSLDVLDSVAQEAIRGTRIDAIVQEAAHRKKKLLIADMESTIITCECLDELAGIAGIRDQVEVITRRAMNGDLNFEAALMERVRLLKGLPESALQKVMDEKVRLMPGAKELVSGMKRQGAYTMLVSGGFDFFAERVAEILGFDEWRANSLEILPSPLRGEGSLSGRVLEPILGKDSKLQALENTCDRLSISLRDALAVGDGANDLPMLLASGLGVAYHAKPMVRAQARARVDHADLNALLYAQGYKIYS